MSRPTSTAPSSSGPTTARRATSFGNQTGQTAGTSLVKDILPTADDGSYPYYLENVAGTLFFSANDGSTGSELWKSDGTAAGTVAAKDIRPGSDGSGPSYLQNVNGTLYFSANDGSTGFEPGRPSPRASSRSQPSPSTRVPARRRDRQRHPRLHLAGLRLRDLSRHRDAAADFTAASGRASVPDSAASTTITVPIAPDTLDEPDESFTVTISNPSIPNSIATNAATVTITDDDLPPNDFNAPKKGKNNLKKGTLTLEVTLPGPGTLSAAQAGKGNRHHEAACSQRRRP